MIFLFCHAVPPQLCDFPLALLRGQHSSQIINLCFSFLFHFTTCFSVSNIQSRTDRIPASASATSGEGFTFVPYVSIKTPTSLSHSSVPTMLDPSERWRRNRRQGLAPSLPVSLTHFQHVQRSYQQSDRLSTIIDQLSAFTENVHGLPPPGDQPSSTAVHSINEV